MCRVMGLICCWVSPWLLPIFVTTREIHRCTSELRAIDRLQRGLDAFRWQQKPRDRTSFVLAGALIVEFPEVGHQVAYGCCEVGVGGQGFSRKLGAPPIRRPVQCSEHSNRARAPQRHEIRMCLDDRPSRFPYRIRHSLGCSPALWCRNGGAKGERRPRTSSLWREMVALSIRSDHCIGATPGSRSSSVECSSSPERSSRCRPHRNDSSARSRRKCSAPAADPSWARRRVSLPLTK